MCIRDSVDDRGREPSSNDCPARCRRFFPMASRVSDEREASLSVQRLEFARQLCRDQSLSGCQVVAGPGPQGPRAIPHSCASVGRCPHDDASFASRSPGVELVRIEHGLLPSATPCEPGSLDRRRGRKTRSRRGIRYWRRARVVRYSMNPSSFARPSRDGQEPGRCREGPRVGIEQAHVDRKVLSAGGLVCDSRGL